MRKPVFRVCDNARLIRLFGFRDKHIVLSKGRTSKALISLHVCAGLFAPLLFASRALNIWYRRAQGVLGIWGEWLYFQGAGEHW